MNNRSHNVALALDPLDAAPASAHGISRRTLVSLEGLAELPDPDPSTDPWASLGADRDESVTDIRDARVRRMVRRLPVRERLVIEWRFGFAGPVVSCSEIARRLGVTRRAVYQIECRALDRLRDADDVQLLRAA